MILKVFNIEKGLPHFLETLKSFNFEKWLHHILMTLKVFQNSVECWWTAASEGHLLYHIMIDKLGLLWVPNFIAWRIYLLFETKFFCNEGIDTCFNAKCLLLGCNFDFLGGYLVVTAYYPVVTACYLVVTACYWWLLLITTCYCLFPLLVWMNLRLKNCLWDILLLFLNLKAHQQISKKQCFEKYYSCDKSCQFSAL